MKIWSGYTKFIRSQVDKKRIVHCPVIGYFGLTSQMYGSVGQGDDNNLYSFQPSVEFIEQTKLLYDEKTPF